MRAVFRFYYPKFSILPVLRTPKPALQALLIRPKSFSSSSRMSSQPPHPLLMIPGKLYLPNFSEVDFVLTRIQQGPIEFHDDVLASMSHPSMSHVGMPFVNVFGESLELFRELLKADKDAQPFVVAGSGTLGWDMVASNLCEKGDNALVLHTGYNSPLCPPAIY